MDEILIDDKKYISSKQAAKISGYAKDYIGQLCREGRVPARLVGRTWYVLESALQDHRFGVPDAQKPKNSPKKAASSIDWATESPRYESVPVELIPPLHRPENAEEKEDTKEANDPDDLQKSWQNWFDRIGTALTTPSTPKEASPEPEMEQIKASEEVIEEKIEDAEINIPIHSVYRMPPKELLPENVSKKAEIKTERKRNGNNRAVVSVVLFFSIALGAFIASAAAIGTGYLDAYLTSNGYTGLYTGVEVYNK